MPNSHLKHLCSVPPSIVKAASNRGNIADFNVAVWLHLPCMAHQIVLLILRYIDGNNVQEVLLDRGKVNAHNKILLAGIARLPVKENITNLEIYICGDKIPEDSQVEELYVEAAEQQPPLGSKPAPS